MKTLAKQTNNGNFVFNLNGIELVIISEKQIIKINEGIYNFNTDLEKETIEIDVNEKDCLFAILPKLNQITELKSEIIKLKEQNSKLINHFGKLPEYAEHGFKSNIDYDKYLHNQLLHKLKTNFKLKSLKSVEENICKVYTTEYSGKNGGFRHFNRNINMSYILISNLNQFSRNKNLFACKLNGEILEYRGNIDKSECL